MIQAEEESGRMMAEFSQRTAEAMEQNFADLFFDVMKGNLRDLQDFTDAILDSMARAVSDYMGQLMRIGMFGASGTGGLVGAVGDWLFSAKGNAFMGGRLLPYAKGGVVNRPTIFPMAAGAGLMGEAGPEAILPLKRGRGGDLGVEASVGGSLGVNIVVNNNASGTQARVEDHGGMNFEVIVEQVENSIAGRAQRGTGIGPWLDGRYRKAT
jgi:lambda family phage tail tape measure protein